MLIVDIVCMSLGTASIDKEYEHFLQKSYYQIKDYSIKETSYEQLEKGASLCRQKEKEKPAFVSGHVDQSSQCNDSGWHQKDQPGGDSRTKGEIKRIFYRDHQLKLYVNEHFISDSQYKQVIKEIDNDIAQSDQQYQEAFRNAILFVIMRGLLTEKSAKRNFEQLKMQRMKRKQLEMILSRARRLMKNNIKCFANY